MTALAQRNFAGGELAPANYARTDQTKYATGLRTLKNMFIKRSGGVSNRAGTQFGAETKNSATASRLIEFVQDPSSGIVYALEFGNGTIRFWQNNALVTVSGVAAWSNATNYVVGDLVVQGGVNYYCVLAHINHVPPNATYWYPLTGAILEIATPYSSSELAAIRFAQSNDIMTLVHPNWAIRELKRAAHTTWTLTKVTVGPALAAPGGFGTAGGAAGAILYWLISAVADETFEEGPAAGGNATNRVPSAGTPTTISWSAVGGALRYHIYRSSDGASYGYIGSSTGLSFTDTGTTPDYLHPAPNATRDPFGQSITPESATAKHPVAVSYYQQRRLFAHPGTAPESVYASKIGLPANFNTSFPLQSDDAVTFSLVGKLANPIQHLLDLGRLILFTSTEEKMVEGDDSGILRPDAINPRKLSANGVGVLRPLEIDDSAVYVQARGSKVRDFKPVASDSYQGTDLTVFASHLFDGYTIVDWAYAQTPHSIVWAVRSDGVLLGLTYLREHAIWGWHRHDTDGVVENVCVIPEGSEDRVYLIVKRIVNGATKRYVERMASRFFIDKEDAYFVDCGITYDGWNVAATTMTLSGGVNWTSDELLTVTASAGTFAAGDVGNVVILRVLDANGNETDRVRLTISSYTSATVVKGFADKTVPVGLRSVAKTTWALAKKVVTGLSHLEGKAVSVLGDGYVVASPNNADYPSVVVTGGVATLPAPYAVVQVGLPFISDVVTLDIDLPGPSTIKNQKILVNRLGLYLEATRGVWAGMPDQPTDDDPLAGLQELKIRELEDYGEPTDPVTDSVEINVEANWNTNGRQLVRQVDPLPMTVLSIMPTGYLPV